MSAQKEAFQAVQHVEVLLAPMRVLSFKWFWLKLRCSWLRHSCSKLNDARLSVEEGRGLVVGDAAERGPRDLYTARLPRMNVLRSRLGFETHLVTVMAHMTSFLTPEQRA